MSFSFAHPSLRRALAAKSYSEPTPVQAAVMAPETADRDLLVSAQTGSGKTVAFGLALAARLLGESEKLGAPGAPRALIVAPTRELALQVHRELSWLYAAAGARSRTTARDTAGGESPAVVSVVGAASARRKTSFAHGKEPSDGRDEMPDERSGRRGGKI